MFRIILGWVFVSACFFSQVGVSDDSLAEQSLRIRVSSDPTTFDWNLLLDVPTELLVYQLMEGLVSLGPDSNIYPALADNWATSKDGKTISFKIKKGVRWSDGQELVAEHFFDSWERVLNPKTAARGADLLSEIKNASAYSAGKINDPRKLGIKIKSKYEIEVTFEGPAKSFIAIFDHPVTFPIRKDLIAKFGDKWTRPENYVTLGAFRLSSWSPGKNVILSRNENYYGKKSDFESVQFLIISDDHTATNMFEKNLLDVVLNLPSKFELKNKIERRKVFPQINNSFIAFNSSKKPFDDLRVRQAFIKAIDLNGLKPIFGDTKSVSKSWIPSGLFGHNEKVGFDYDPAGAKKLISESDYAKEKSWPRIVFSLNASEDHRLLGERLQHMWKKTLGVNVEIELMDWASYVSKIKSDTPQIFRMGAGLVYADPHLFMSVFGSTGIFSFIKFESKKYDSLIQRGLKQANGDLKERAQTYNQAQNIILKEQAVILPVYQSNMPVLLSDKAKSLVFNGRGKFQIKEI